jgi:hypothetical protein
MDLLAIFVLCFCLIFSCRNMNIYLVPSAFTCRPNSILVLASWWTELRETHHRVQYFGMTKIETIKWSDISQHGVGKMLNAVHSECEFFPYLAPDNYSLSMFVFLLFFALF